MCSAAAASRKKERKKKVFLLLLIITIRSRPTHHWLSSSRPQSYLIDTTTTTWMSVVEGEWEEGRKGEEESFNVFIVRFSPEQVEEEKGKKKAIAQSGHLDKGRQ
jgi:hypothetical protein